FSGDGTIAVVDTHVLLHYRLFDEIDWRSVIDEDDLLLIVPLRVVDELDTKKSARRLDLRDRARTVIRHLEACLERGGAVRPGVRLEVVALPDLDPETYRKPQLPSDVEILDVCEGVAIYASPRSTHLVTGDLGMR